MTRRLRILSMALWSLCGCATPHVGTVIDSDPLPRAVQVPEWASAVSIAYLGVEIPVTGTTIGGHYDGRLKTFKYPYVADRQMETTWSDLMNTLGTQMLKDAGYSVTTTSRIFFELEDHSDVRFILAGSTSSMTLDTYGRQAGNRTVASMTVLFELFDAETRQVVYSRELDATAAIARQSGDAVYEVFQRIFAKLLADRRFVASFRTGRPPLESAPTAEWETSPLEEGAIVTLTPDDLQVLDGGSAFDKVSAATITLNGTRGQGTAFIISKNGYALTNHHVIADQKSLYATMLNGEQRAARVLRANQEADVALLQVDCKVACNTVPLSAQVTPQVGSDVYVVGTPLGDGYRHSVTKGIVSKVRLLNGVGVIQTDAAVNPGNSGGPIVDGVSGVVLGVATSKLVREDVEGIAFGVLIDDALRVVGVRLAGF